MSLEKELPEGDKLYLGKDSNLNYVKKYTREELLSLKPVSIEKMPNCIYSTQNGDKFHLKNDIFLDGGYLFPQLGGCVHNSITYSEHALERMAPCTCDMIDLLTERALEKMKTARCFDDVKYICPDTECYEVRHWWESFCPIPRGILPTTVEKEMKDPGSTGLRIIWSDDDVVVTVFYRFLLSDNFREDYKYREFYTDENDNFGSLMSPFVISKDIEQKLVDVKNLIMYRARFIKSQRLVSVSPYDVSGLELQAKIHAEGKRAKHVRQQSIVLNDLAKENERKRQEAKARRNTKTIDLSAVKANRAILKAAQIEAKKIEKAANTAKKLPERLKSSDKVVEEPPVCVVDAMASAYVPDTWDEGAV